MPPRPPAYRLRRSLLPLLLATFAAAPLQASDPSADLARELAGLSLEDLFRSDVSTASKVRESLSQTPISVSILNREEIRSTGARDLADALALLPGLQSYRDTYGQTRYVVRGLSRLTSSDLLFLLDGQPLQDAYLGAPGGAEDLPLELLDRIEVARGPGSVVYGANAFLGVVNLVTRPPQTLRGGELTLRAEAAENGFFAQSANLLAGDQITDGLFYKINLNLRHTTGQPVAASRVIAPLAPNAQPSAGFIDNDEDLLDLLAQIRWERPWGRLSLESRYHRRQAGAFADADTTYGDTGSQDLQSLSLSLEAIYRPAPDWECTLTAQTLASETERANTASLLFGPQSATVSTASAWNSQTSSTEFRAVFTGCPSHTLLIAFGAESQRVTRITSTVTLASQNTHTETPDQNRENLFIYLSELWDITPTLHLNAGLRFDHYSDFGSNYSPRAGLTWQPTPALTLKALYGTAFRAPEFTAVTGDLQNGFGVLFRAPANPDLRSEKIATAEIGATLQLTRGLRLQATAFRSEATDIIFPDTTNTTFQNLDATLRAQGIETEITADLPAKAKLTASYSWTQTTPNIGAPRWNGALRLDAPLSPHLHANLNATFHGPFGTLLDASDTYSSGILINTSLLIRDLPWKNAEWQITLHNLLDQKNRFNGLYSEKPGPGRSLSISFRHTF